MTIRSVSIAAVLCALSLAHAAENPEAVLAEAIEHTRRDIQEVKSQLLARRKEISSERVALSRRLSELTAEVEGKRQIRRLRLKARDESDAPLQTLRAKADALQEQLTITRSFLMETRRGVGVQPDIIDAVVKAPELEELDRLLAAAGEDVNHIPSVAEGLLEFMARHVDETGRIRWTSSRAIGPDGREFEGTFVQIGGVQALFAGEAEGAPSGIVQLQHGSSRPHVMPAPTSEAQAAIARLGRGEEAVVPIDLTSGAALRTRKRRGSLGERISSGGVVMIPIIIIGIVCMLVGVWKLTQLVRIRTDFDAPLARLLGLLSSGRVEEATALAQESSPPLRRLMEEGMAHREASREDLEEVMHEAIIVEVPPLERYLAVLAVGATVSPLLGLLGTVTGMIHTFSLIAVHGTGDPRLLSSGISEALITTEAGLVIAIPLLLLYAFLSRRVRAISDGLEKGAVSFINTLKTRNETEALEYQREPEDGVT